MQFTFVKMKRKYARKIAEWKYGDEYSYCDFCGWKNERRELRCGLYFAALGDGELVGFMSFGITAQWPASSLKNIYRDQSYTDIAMGLAPSLCGKGLGSSFADACFDFAKDNFPDDGIRLSVDARNVRALKMYESKGFTLFHTEKTENGPEILIYIRK